MPNTKSAIKQIKTDLGRNLRNKSRKSAIHTYEKKFLAKVQEKDMNSAEALLKETISQYDKAAKTGTLHKNQTNRKKSRLTAIYNKGKSGSQPTESNVTSD